MDKTTADCGTLTPRERRLVKLALSFQVGSVGAVHSHTRRARSAGIELAAVIQVTMLAIGPLGLPRTVAAKTWIENIKE